MEDNLKREFALGLHLHRAHAETFYILDGIVNFHIDGDWMAAAPGACVHIPPGVPHALDLPPGGTGRCLMIFQPAGFEQFLEELAGLSEAQLADEADGSIERKIRHHKPRRRADERVSGRPARRRGRSIRKRVGLRVAARHLSSITPRRTVMHFRIRGLPAEQFAPLFTLSYAELAAQGAVRRIADRREPGYPCRVSLTNSKPGDELILVNYEHHDVASTLPDGLCHLRAQGR